MGWTPDQLGSLEGNTYAITGGNGGLGLEAAKILAAHGGRVVITSRRAEKAEQALATIRAHAPGADVSYVLLDLADPDSTNAAADSLVETCPRLDALINNAGVMQTPQRATKEGFELQLGTNHLGHFRLVARLYPHLVASAGRVVPVSSIAHRQGRIHFGALMLSTNYSPTTAYTQSKLANLLFAFELHRRLTAAGSPVTSSPAIRPRRDQSPERGRGQKAVAASSSCVQIHQQAWPRPHVGAYPEVLAAAWSDAKPGVYYGPTSR